jgi:hypothetical protein
MKASGPRIERSTWVSAAKLTPCRWLPGKQPGDACPVGDVPVHEPIAWHRLDIRQVLQVAGIGQGIHVDDPVFRVPADPVVDEIGADKTGAAGYQQSAHACNSFSILSRLSRQCGMGAVSRY